MFRRVLIANRGEIACRVIATCRRLGIHTIAVYSEADLHARHVRMADEAHLVGPPPARESYLDAARILEVARRSRAEAVHPGYGFLSENEDFAAACAAAGIVFIGPSPEVIRRMGLKHEAKAAAGAAGVPVVPGWYGETADAATLLGEARRIGFPLLVKAVAGGGGKGMRVVRDADELVEAVAAAGREAASAFGDGRVMIERFLERPRHVEVQVFGDSHGNHVHLFERECSIQRRYQKIIEESPSPFLDAALRQEMTQAAVRMAAAVGYVNAGTVEFVVDDSRRFYFLEVNTRLQVEHPVTEAVTGLDLVEWQLRVAAGEPLPLTQEAIRCTGHAIEARVYSEDPERGFLPSTGRIERFAFPPEEDGFRVDRGVDDGDRVEVHYDPMIAKLIAFGPDRAAATARLRRALARSAVFGPRSNLVLLRRIVAHADFAAGAMDTGYLDRNLAQVLQAPALPGPSALLAAAHYALDRLARSAGTAPHDPWDRADAWQAGGLGGATLGLATPQFQRLRARRDGALLEVQRGRERWQARVAAGEHDTVSLDGTQPLREVTLVGHGPRLIVTDEHSHEMELVDAWPFEADAAEADTHPVSPLPGRVVALHVREGDAVTAGMALAVVEGMKMQHTVRATRNGRIGRLRVSEGEQVEAETVLCDIAPA
ncbi:MAG: ATP-grasp domain-containing protein [Steroidobacteraceae bacterium]|jgi:3-methylcrotonyl-CoA carboxylase alpha subunit|nr:ATP-grasp domain-containing protein [Steroidobacteraceae bacterium]